MLRPASAVFAVTVAAAFAWTGGAEAQVEMGGPAVPGACFLSQVAVLTTSKIGQAATARLQQFHRQAQAAVDSERRALSAEAAQIQADRGELGAEALRRKQEDLTAKLQAMQTDAQTRINQIDATRRKAMEAISEDAKPVIAQAYAAHRCALVFDRGVLLGGNLSGDLTADVVRALDARVTTITFDLEPPPTTGPASKPAQ